MISARVRASSAGGSGGFAAEVSGRLGVEPGGGAEDWADDKAAGPIAEDSPARPTALRKGRRAWFGWEGRDMGASLSRREVAAERGGSYSPVAGPANGGGGWTGRGQALESPQAGGLTNGRHSAHVPALPT